MIKNFRYDEEGRIARGGYPETAEAVDWLHDQGIRAVLSLHPVPEAAQARMRELGIEWKPWVLSDFASDVPPGLDEAVRFVRQHAEAGQNVLIHCQGGGGRSGTMYAAYLIAQGVPVESVLVQVPGVEKDVNRAFLRGFAAGLAARG